MSDVTICTTTILREECVRRLLSSIEESSYSGKTVVVDQNARPLELDDFNLQIEQVHRPDCGFGPAHNLAADRVDTEYMLWMDDDIAFNEEGLSPLITDMEDFSRLGWLSPVLRPPVSPKNLEVRGKVLCKFPVGVDGLTFCDMPVQAASLWRTELYDDVRWPELKTGYMHAMMALELKKTHWRTAADNRGAFVHDHRDPGSYARLRGRWGPSEEYLKRKYGIEAVKICKK